MVIDLLSLCIGILAGAAIAALYLEIKSLRSEMSLLREDKVKALPHGTLASLEDIKAIVTDVHFQHLEADDLVKAMLYYRSMNEYNMQAFERIGKLATDIREAPRKYKDRPSRKVRMAG